VDFIVARGMARLPQDRYQTIGEFCDTLLAAFHPNMKPSGSNGTSQPALASAGIFSAQRNPESAEATGSDTNGDTGATPSALFRPLFVFSGFDLEPGTPIPAPSPLHPAESQAAPPAEEPVPLLRRPVFWIGVALTLVVLAAAVVGGFFAYEYL
jgi:hypothetical protein